MTNEKMSALTEILYRLSNQISKLQKQDFETLAMFKQAVDIITTMDAQLDNHETRMKKLESVVFPLVNSLSDKKES